MQSRTKFIARHRTIPERAQRAQRGDGCDDLAESESFGAERVVLRVGSPDLLRRYTVPVQLACPQRQPLEPDADASRQLSLQYSEPSCA